MLKRYGDSIVNYVDDLATDEFESAMYHKASSVGLYTSLVIVAAVGALLAWVIPGQHALWSAFVLLIPALGDAISTQWMRNYVARPVIRFADIPRSILLTYFALCVIWLIGLIVTGGFGPAEEFDQSGAAGAAVGAVVGLVTAVSTTGWITKRKRDRDQERLNAEMDD